MNNDVSAQKNPSWVEAELILTMDLYYTHESNTKHGSAAEMRELSNLLRRLNLFEDIPNPEKFRNFAGVSSKIGNLQYLDDEDKAKGFSGASAMDRYVWNKYKGQTELLHQLAETIKKSVNTEGSLSYPVDNEEEQSFPEGKVLFRMHRQRERNGQVVQEAKHKAESNGTLCCSVCGFDFKKAYGDIGEGYIEAHHTKPISEYQENDVTTVDDLVLVCANCHRMLHRRRPWLSANELKKILKDNSLEKDVKDER